MEEQELSLSSDNTSFLAAIILSSDDAIEGLTLEGDVIIWNKGSEELYGYSSKEITGKSILSVYPKDRMDELPSILSKIKKGEHVKPYITQRKRKDGTLIDVAVSASPIKNKKGMIVGASVISRPFAGQERIVAAALKAEKLIRKSEILFRQFAEHTKEVFWSMTPEMDQTVYVSPAYEEIWGQSSASLYANPHEWMESIIEADQEKVRLFLAKLRQQEYASTEYRIIRPDGVIKDIFVKGFQVKDENRKLINIIGIAVDITGLVQLNAQASIGILAIGIAHEINNLITWIFGNLDFIKKNVSLDRCKLEELLSESIQGTERIRDIVHNLKGFARVDENEITSIDLNHIIDSVLTITSMEIKFRAQVETDYAKNIPSFEGNSSQLHQVFLNLILNAAQAIPIGDSQNNKIRITTTQEDKQIRIDVSDTGCGMKAEILSKIFDPFFTTKPMDVGTGLGLSISYKIVKSFGGKITVKSSPGKGSTFSVYLPLQPKIKASSERLPEAKTIPAIIRKCILVVDDEPYLLKSIQRMLQDQHDIITAPSGKMAIELLEKNKNQYDLIITDLSMPDGSGADLYHFIAAKFPGLERRIIFMTGTAYTANLRGFLTSVNNACLNKPFEQDKLLQLIENVYNENSKIKK